MKMKPLATALAFGVASLASTPATAVTATSIQITNPSTYLQVAEVQATAFNFSGNAALGTNGATASATSVYPPVDNAQEGLAANAIDGNTGGNYYTDFIYHGASSTGGDVLTINLPSAFDLSSLTVFGRSDCCSERDTFTYSLFNGLTQVASGVLNATGATHSATATFASGAPEPGTWGMMLLGFGIAGGALRRRPRKVRARLA